MPPVAIQGKMSRVFALDNTDDFEVVHFDLSSFSTYFEALSDLSVMIFKTERNVLHVRCSRKEFIILCQFNIECV